MQWLFIFLINISWSYFCPYCSIHGNIQILHSIAEYCYFLWFNQTFMVETFRADSIFRHTYDEWVKSPPSHWMTLIYLLSFTSSIHWSSDHSLPRQGFDFSSEEMSENNHFHRQLTLLAPFPFRIGCVLTPYWSCLLPTSKRLIPTSSISRSTIIWSPPSCMSTTIMSNIKLPSF